VNLAAVDFTTETGLCDFISESMAYVVFCCWVMRHCLRRGVDEHKAVRVVKKPGDLSTRLS
jgi:hypothetical protein